MTNGRLQKSMTCAEATAAMSEGNLGAATACTNLIMYTPAIDPDYMRSGIGPLRTLDRLGIYGARLYTLWNDVCGRDVTKMIALLRDTQLNGFGRTSKAQIDYTIDGTGDLSPLRLVLLLEGSKPNFEAILKRVMKHVNNFSPLSEQGV